MSTFDYRRKLERTDWLRLLGAAGGAGLGIAAVITYFGRLWMQRVPLPRGDEPDAAAGDRLRIRRVDPAQLHESSESR
jgi:hypothetical protein